MNTTMRRALRRLAHDAQLSLELARELNRQVAAAQAMRRIYCSEAGDFYVAGKPAGGRDLSLCTLQAGETSRLSGAEFATGPQVGVDGETRTDAAWDLEAENLRRIVAELAEWELQPHGD